MMMLVMMMTETMPRTVNLALLFTGNLGALASERLPRETEPAKPAEELQKKKYPSLRKLGRKFKLALNISVRIKTFNLLQHPPTYNSEN